MATESTVKRSSSVSSEATTTYDTRSIAPSELTLTEAEEQQHAPPEYTRTSVGSSSSNEDDPSRFTAAGRPMPKAAPRSFATSLGHPTANTLPVRFKDTSFISIPIKREDIDAALADQEGSASLPPSYGAGASATRTASNDGAEQKETTEKPRKSSFFSGLGKSSKGAKSSTKEAKKPAFQTVKMTRAEYLTYFAKGEKGEYICTEPRESGMWKQVLRARLEDADLQALGRTDTRMKNTDYLSFDGLGLSMGAAGM